MTKAEYENSAIKNTELKREALVSCAEKLISHQKTRENDQEEGACAERSALGIEREECVEEAAERELQDDWSKLLAERAEFSGYYFRAAGVDEGNARRGKEKVRQDNDMAVQKIDAPDGKVVYRKTGDKGRE